MRYFVLMILLSGCANVQLTDQQLMSMSNEQLCQVVAEQPLNAKVIAYESGRNLSCHPAEITCRNAGFKINSAPYIECVKGQFHQIADEQEASRRKRKAVAAALGDLGDSMSRRSTTTNCYGGSTWASCTTY